MHISTCYVICYLYLVYSHRDEFIIVENPGQFMIWCEKILTSEDGMKDKECWQVVDAVFPCA